MGITGSMPVIAGASFSELPLELVVSIAEFLPPECIAAMALMTKSLYGSPQLQQMWRPDVECKPNKLIFLLARDVPKSVLCTSCHCLHPRRNTPIRPGYIKLGVCILRLRQSYEKHYTVHAPYRHNTHFYHAKVILICVLDESLGYYLGSIGSVPRCPLVSHPVSHHLHTFKSLPVEISRYSFIKLA